MIRSGEFHNDKFNDNTNIILSLYPSHMHVCGVIMCLPNLDHNIIIILQYVIMIVWVTPTTSSLCYFSILSYFVLGSPTHIVFFTLMLYCGFGTIVSGGM